jgi:hypothetical protein
MGEARFRLFDEAGESLLIGASPAHRPSEPHRTLIDHRRLGMGDMVSLGGCQPFE